MSKKNSKKRPAARTLVHLYERKRIGRRTAAVQADISYARLLEIELGSRPTRGERARLDAALGGTPKSYTTILANTVRMRRIHAGIIASYMAGFVCCSTSTYSKWEAGTGAPEDVHSLDLVAQALECSVADLADPVILTKKG